MVAENARLCLEEENSLLTSLEQVVANFQKTSDTSNDICASWAEDFKAYRSLNEALIAKSDPDCDKLLDDERDLLVHLLALSNAKNTAIYGSWRTLFEERIGIIDKLR